jgi:hypothetical protein
MSVPSSKNESVPFLKSEMVSIYRKDVLRHPIGVRNWIAKGYA